MAPGMVVCFTRSRSNSGRPRKKAKLSRSSRRSSWVMGAMFTALRETLLLSWMGQASTQSPQPVQSSGATW